MLKDYIKENYRAGEVIFTANIHIDGMSRENFRQQLKTLTDNGELIRCDDGVYLIPGTGRLKGYIGISSVEIAEIKYIKNKNNIIGYYTGNTFANQFGILEQVPNKREIATNNTSAIVKTVRLAGHEYLIRKAVTEVTNDNYMALQLLDMLKNIEDYNNLETEQIGKKIQNYVINNKISRQQIDEYIYLYPMKVYKAIYEMRLDNVFA